MPLTKSGEKVLQGMRKQYGAKRGERIFYASINKGVAGSEKWHGKSKKSSRKSKRRGKK